MTPALQALCRRVLVAALVSCLILSANGAARAATEEQRLDTSQAQLDGVRAELDAARQQQSADLAALGEAEQQLRTVLAAVDEAEQAVKRQQGAVTAARDKLAALTRRVAVQRAALSEHAVELYKQLTGGSGAGDDLKSVLSAASSQEAMIRSAYVSAATHADRRALEELDAAARAAAAQRRALEEKQAALERMVDKQRRLVADAEKLREERVLQLAASSARVLELLGGEDHASADREQLAALALGASRQRTDLSASRGGRAEVAAALAGVPGLSTDTGWVWPAAAGTITSGFGPRWGRMHEGIDVAAPVGTPILAAKAGIVTFAGRQGGYGNLVLIDHGGGLVTAYGHQSRIHVTVGQFVQAGEHIGDVGSTGRSTGPHLHFEVRVNGEPQNPRSHLGR